MGPLGHMLKPVGLLDESEAEKIYSEQAEVLSGSGVDLIINRNTILILLKHTSAIREQRRWVAFPFLFLSVLTVGKKP